MAGVLRALAARPSIPLFLCLFSAQAAVLALSPVLAELATDLDVSTAVAGQLRTVSGAVAAVAGLAVARTAARLSLRGLLLAGLALLAGGCALSAAAPGFGVLLAAQVPIGLGVAAVVSGGLAGAAEWAPPGRRAHVLSWAILGQPAAWVVGMPVIGVAGEVTWRLAWVVVPMGAAVAALVVVAARRDGERRPPPPRGGTAALLREPHVAAWAAGEVLAFSAWAGVLVYSGALFIESYGVSLPAAGLLLAAGAVAYFPGNFLARRWIGGTARRLLVVVALLAAATTAVLGAVRPWVWFSALVFCLLAFLGGARTIAGSAFGLDAAGDRRLAVMGVRTTALQLGYLVGAAAGGAALAVGGYGLLGATFAGFFALAAAPHLVLAARERRPSGSSAPAASRRPTYGGSKEVT